jgi:hypothetical protein
MDIKTLFSQIQPKAKIQYVGNSTYIAESTLWVQGGQGVEDIFGNRALIMSKIGNSPTKIIVNSPTLHNLLVFPIQWYFGSLYDVNQAIVSQLPDRFAWLVEGYSLTQNNYYIDKALSLSCEIVLAEHYPLELFENVDHHYEVISYLEMAFHLMRYDFESNGIIVSNANCIDFNRTAFFTQDKDTETPFVERYTGVLVRATFLIDANRCRFHCQ